MGTWYETDFLSHLPIMEGDDVVMILVKERKYTAAASHACCNTYDKYNVFGLPIHGKYNEIGAVTKIKNADDVLEYLNTQEFICDKHSGNIKFPLTSRNLERFLVAVSQGDVTVKSGELVTCMFVDERLYRLLIDNYRNRSREDDGRVNTYEQLYDKKLDSFIEYAKERTKKDEDYFDDDFGFWTYVAELERYYNCLLISNSMTVSDIVPYLIKRICLNDNANVRREYLKELVFFDYVLESMRSGYLCVSGKGGIMNERLLHKLLAQYILEKTDAYVAEYWKENKRDDSLTDDDILSDEVTDILWLG